MIEENGMRQWAHIDLRGKSVDEIEAELNAVVEDIEQVEAYSDVVSKAVVYAFVPDDRITYDQKYQCISEIFLWSNDIIDQTKEQVECDRLGCEHNEWALTYHDAIASRVHDQTIYVDLFAMITQATHGSASERYLAARAIASIVSVWGSKLRYRADNKSA